MSSDPGANLLQRAREWDPHALAEIHDRYYAQIYRYVLIRLGEEVVAEDIASEAFLRLLDAVQAGKAPHTSVRGWLFGTAAHLIGDYVRRAPRERRRVSEDFRSGVSTEAEVEDRLLFGQIRAALHQLTRDQEQVILLRFGNGFPLEETAEIMGKTVGAVKVLQFRATAALREVMSRTENE